MTTDGNLLRLPTPPSFPAFPYNPPYDIQVDMMKHLYTSIEEKKVTIVESPTGTGKTLTLLCASLTWLADERNRARKGHLAALVTGDDIGWVVEQTMERQKRELDAEERDYQDRLAKARKREAIMKRMAVGRVVKKLKLTHDKDKPADDDDDAAFLPNEEVQEEEDNYSPAVRALMKKMHSAPGQAQEEEPTCTKIYYASRTHSQLTQLVPELRKLKLPSPVRIDDSFTSHVSSNKRKFEATDDKEQAVHTRVVSLGSRKQLCINKELRAKSKDLDEGCRELLGEKKEKRCEFLPPMDDQSRMTDLRDLILASPKDIEDLASTGIMAHTCPYFGSRKAIPQAELVTLPYNLLLSKTAREALGIDLTNQVVIIDEAHNLISSLLSLSTTRLTLHTLHTSLEQVSFYSSKFRTRLASKHASHIKRLILFLSSLKNFAEEWRAQHIKPDAVKTQVMTVAELVKGLGRKVEGINLLEIEKYLRASKIARKIAGYSDKIAERNAAKDPSAKKTSRGATPPLHAIEAFMLAVTSAEADGRVILSIVGTTGQEQLEIKYQQLNPSTHFQDILDTARSVVLAGGTMSPMSDFTSQLMSGLPSTRLSTFSCGHIIPAENLRTIVLSKGPRNGVMDFRFSQRQDTAILAELGQILLNLVNLVPGGMVVFFPSYSFLNSTKASWEKANVLDNLKKKKTIFQEPQDGSEVDAILKEYSAKAKSTGALLFAVIGAKLSEGLNFSDDLARAVVVVGLPFANKGSPELQERMKYASRALKKVREKDAGQELYENMCMNSVNQSIGRAIRHQKDWASLILVDHRFRGASIQGKLPKWIKQDLVVAQTFGQAVKSLGSFYREHRTAAT